MVRLTVTPAMLQVLEYHKVCKSEEPLDGSREWKLGDPITHDQVIALSKQSRKHGDSSKLSEVSTPDLATLLKGSQVYIEPPKPKPEPTSEFKALMARLREEEEERQYERMINPAPAMQSFAQRFPGSNYSQLFPGVSKQDEDEEVTFADVNRQVTLIFNILISIVACAVAIWMATRYWPTPQRLGISMGGGGLVGVAEVVVYAGYLRRVKEAKQKEKRKVEKKTIIDTWVIQPKTASTGNSTEKIIMPESREGPVRKRLSHKGKKQP